MRPTASYDEYIALQSKLRQELNNKWREYYQVDGLSKQKGNNIKFTPTSAVQGILSEISQQLSEMENGLLIKNPNETPSQRIERNKMQISDKYAKLVEMHKRAKNSGILGKDDSWEKILLRYPELRAFVQKHIKNRENQKIIDTISLNPDDYAEYADYEATIAKANLVNEYSSADWTDFQQKLKELRATLKAREIEYEKSKTASRNRSQGSLPPTATPARTQSLLPANAPSELRDAERLIMDIKRDDRRLLMDINRDDESEEDDVETDVDENSVQVPDLRNINRRRIQKIRARKPRGALSGKKLILDMSPDSSPEPRRPKPTKPLKKNKNKVKINVNKDDDEGEEQIYNKAEVDVLNDNDDDDWQERQQELIARRAEEEKRLLENQQKQDAKVAQANDESKAIQKIYDSFNQSGKNVAESTKKLVKNLSNIIYERSNDEDIVAQASSLAKDLVKSDNKNNTGKDRKSLVARVKEFEEKVAYTPSYQKFGEGRKPKVMKKKAGSKKAGSKKPQPMRTKMTEKKQPHQITGQQPKQVTFSPPQGITIN